jgi:SAM-dependent methyltransferase
LIKEHGRQGAAEIGVGSDFAAVGRLELACLLFFGLKPGDFVVDVGCGSGRLATALKGVADIRYHGTDVVDEFVRHARGVSPSHFRFSLVDGLTIPEADGVADLVTFFSVATHLHLHETYLYLQEAKRVLKPGGIVVVSFLELQNPLHWPIFEATAAATREGALAHLNAFIEEPALRVCAGRIGLTVETVLRGGTPSIPISESIAHEDGRVQRDYADLGHSLVVLRSPVSSQATDDAAL